MGVIIKKVSYVCSGLLNFTWGNGPVPARKRRILTAEYFVKSYCYL